MKGVGTQRSKSQAKLATKLSSHAQSAAELLSPWSIVVVGTHVVRDHIVHGTYCQRDEISKKKRTGMVHTGTLSHGIGVCRI